MLPGKLTTTRGRVLTAALLALIAVLVWSIGVFGVHPMGHARTRIMGDNGLLTTNRTNLQVCVASKVQSLPAAVLRGRAQDALERVARHPRFKPVGYGAAPTRVAEGCPTPARIAEPGFDPRAGHSNVGGIGVDQPTPYRAYVFVVPQQQLAVLAGLGSRRVPQEVYCDPGTDSCAAVSVAIYLSPSEVANLPLFARELTGALGLNPARLQVQ